MMDARPVLVVLSGGASNVAVQLYALAQIRNEYGLEALELHGTSGGAVLALAAIVERIDLAEDLLRNLDRWTALRWPWQWTWGVYSLHPLRTAMLKALEGTTVKGKAWVHVVDPSGGRWGAGKYQTIALHELSNHAARVEAVLCSCTQRPLIMERSFHQGRSLIDGGVHHPMGVVDVVPGQTVYYLSAAPLTHDPVSAVGPKSGLWHWLLSSTGILTALEELRALIAGDHQDDLRRIQEQAHAGAHVILVEPQVDPGDPMDFSPEARAWRLDEVGPDAWAARQEL